MERPQIEYTKSGDAYIAYQVFGRGPIDLVLVTEYFTPLDARWDLPILASALERLGSFARVVSFDKRGIGCSDPVPIQVGSTAEAWMEDVGAVLDAVGSQRAAVMGAHDGGAPSMLFAATHPDRTSHLVLVNTTARAMRDDDYPWGFPASTINEVDAFLDDASRYWDEGWKVQVRQMFGRDRSFDEWFRRHVPVQASASVSAALFRADMRGDVRDALGLIAAPTLVVHREDNRFWRVGHGRYLGEHISGARYVELPGRANAWWSEEPDRVIDEIEEFLTGTRGSTATNRVLATVLFTDVVSSTERTAELGDRKWRELIDAHDALVKREIDKARGKFISASGDGVLATFDGPARAIRCAQSIAKVVSDIGIDVRAGLHAGEVELRRDDVAGISVNLAHRVMELAGPKEVLVSRTVVDLVAGSGIEFADRGPHALKGIPGDWQLYEVVAG